MEEKRQPFKRIGLIAFKLLPLDNVYEYTIIPEQKVSIHKTMIVLHSEIRSPSRTCASHTPARSFGSVERDREVIRLLNDNALQGANRALPVVVDNVSVEKDLRLLTALTPFDDMTPEQAAFVVCRSRFCIVMQ
ncbi:hypothetical protein Tco_1280867 [Tanacetum coccineum]